jgi:hypothetical protein
MAESIYKALHNISVGLVRRLLAAIRAQEQDFVLPDCNDQPKTVTNVPYVQRHFQRAALLPPGFLIDPANSITVSR